MNRAWPLLIVASLSPLAQAQTCGLRNGLRFAQGMCDGTAPGEVFVDSGTATAGPLVTPASSGNSNWCGCHSQFSASMMSDYGSLNYNVNANGNSCNCCGIFVWVDPGTVVPRAQFWDRVTVSSESLTAGTPVSIRATLRLVGGVSQTNPHPDTSFSGQLGISGAISRSLLLSNQAGTTSSTFDIAVGSAIDISGQLHCTLRDYTLMFFNQVGTLNADIQVETTFEVLTQGATLVACSGHNYAPGCPADLDDGTGLGTADGGVDINDLLYFLTQFESGSVAADLDNGSGNGTQDGGVDISDLLYFLVRFEQGC